uniref:Uncharacterized protein n=1 Tax=Oryza punctata TaxID=4537 RepID=A0A0E0JIH3_ORYPU
MRGGVDLLLVNRSRVTDLAAPPGTIAVTAWAALSLPAVLVRLSIFARRTTNAEQERKTNHQTFQKLTRATALNEALPLLVALPSLQLANVCEHRALRCDASGPTQLNRVDTTAWR